jgi:hypothetical protein
MKMKKATPGITKKVSLITASVCIAIFALASISSAASLTKIYDFTYLDPIDIAFEGLAFTDDGTLWITSAPNFASNKNKLLGVDLEKEEVTSVSELDMANPVGLASDGTELYIANNHKNISFMDFADPVFTGTVDSATGQVTTSESYSLPAGTIVEPEGAAYLNGSLYFSGEESNNIIAVDQTTGMITNYDMGISMLGLGATKDSLIIGDYTNHNLLLYNVSTNTVTETISLADLFVGIDSDYNALTGEDYEVVIADNGDVRYIPDPDGIAYKDGSIFMTFEHDLRVFEISLGDTSSVPEPGTAILLILGLVGLGFIRRGKK